MTGPAERASKAPTPMAAASGDATTTTNVYCPALASGCFALRITMTQLEGTTKYVISIQNLQGSYGTGTAPFGINGIMFGRVNYTIGAVKPTDTILWGGLDDNFPLLSGQVRANTCCTALWEDALIPINFEAIAHNDHWTSQWGFVGCTLPSSSDDLYIGVFDLQTCPKKGLNGWVTFNYHFYTTKADPDGNPGPIMPGITTLGYANFSVGGCAFLPTGGNSCPTFPYPKPK